MSSIAQTASTAVNAASNTSSAAKASTTPSSGGATIKDPYDAMGSEGFLKLLINELQNQDPLNPMDNAAMVQQLGEIRQISATDSLTKSLSSLSDNQELVTASGLIGRTVTGLTTDASEVTGTVDSVTVETNADTNARSVKVLVGGKTMEVKNIREIVTAQT